MKKFVAGLLVLAMLIGVVSFLFIFERPIDRTVEESGDNSAPPVVTSPFDEPEETTQTMKISSTAFENNAEIPSKYSCDGDDITPPLQISDIPENTESLVIISDDRKLLQVPGYTGLYGT